MEKTNKMGMVLGGIELLTALGVSTIVGGALTLVRPKELGAIKKIAVGVGGLAISSMASEGVVDYVDKKFHDTVDQIKGVFCKKEPEEEEETSEEVEAE